MPTMKSIKNVKPYMWDSKERPKDAPEFDEVVMGFDEVKKKWVKVQYREDSNVFFPYPYTGALYPEYRMHRWRGLDEK